jgi:hypothetical protein
MPPSRPPTSARPPSTMSRPAGRPAPRPMGRGR